MNDYVQQYMDSIETENTKKVAKHIFKRIENDDGNIGNYNAIQMEQLVLSANPNSIKDIITTVYVLSSYTKWLQKQNIIDNDNAYQILQSLDKKSLWQKARPTAKKKFIDNKQFKQIIHDIEMYEEYNSLYYTTLFQAVYEGLYNDDLSVLKNLRGKDINTKDNIVTLHEDSGHTYKIKVSERLAKDLKQLSHMDKWLRPNRFGLCQVDVKGVYPDSVFKVESRTTNSENSYKFSYYSKLRKIAKEFVGYSLLPLQLYASGIMHRIKIELEKNNITLEEAFSQSNRNRIAHMIIEKELIRTNSGIEIGNLREMVKGHIDVF